MFESMSTVRSNPCATYQDSKRQREGPCGGHSDGTPTKYFCLGGGNPVPLVPPKQARPSSHQWLDPDGLEPAAERARVCWTIRSVPVGLCVVRLASRTHTLRHCAGLAPTLADLLEPSSQRTRLPLGLGCHLHTPPKDGCVDTTPGARRSTNLQFVELLDARIRASVLVRLHS
jgi:hypothetical protein